MIGAAETARLIARRELSSVEAVTEALERADDCNALAARLHESALAQAAERDRQAPVGPLHGVPVTVKTSLDLAGSPTTSGVVARAHHMPERTGPEAEGYLRAGAVVVGRGNAPDFSLRLHTDNALHGATLNPLDRTRSPGGSGGGEAVAVATGLSALGLGGDVGGSLRVPAQWNGVMALKATPGRIPSSESGLSLAAMTSFGPFARSVEDLRLGYGALAREDPRDPWGVSGPGQVEAPRAVVVLDPPDADPGVRAAIRAAAKALEAAGYELRDDDVPPGLDDMPDLWARLFLTEVHSLWDELGPLLGGDCRQWLRDAFVARPPLTTSGELIEAYRERHALAAAWPATLVLAPVMTIGAPPVGFDLQGPEALERLFRRARYCWAPNVLGRPAVAAKGVQLIGPRFGEALCLDAAGAL